MVRARGWIHFSLRVDKRHCTSTVLVPIFIRVRYDTVPAPFGLPFCVAFAPQRHYSTHCLSGPVPNTLGNTAPVCVHHFKALFSSYSVAHIIFICCNRYKYSSTFLCLPSSQSWYSAGRGKNAGHQSNAGKFYLS